MLLNNSLHLNLKMFKVIISILSVYRLQLIIGILSVVLLYDDRVCKYRNELWTMIKFEWIFYETWNLDFMKFKFTRYVNRNFWNSITHWKKRYLGGLTWMVYLIERVHFEWTVFTSRIPGDVQYWNSNISSAKSGSKRPNVKRKVLRASS